MRADDLHDPANPYGWRHFRRVGPDGREDWDVVPITPEESFDPQEGDVISQRPTHNTDIVYLNEVLDNRTTGQGLLLCHCIVDWDIPGLRQHSPDISFFPGVERPPGDWGTYRVEWNGVRARFLIEVTSPETRKNDLETKVEEYQRAGVAYYVIVDRYATDTPHLIGYRQTPDGFVRMELDENQRLLLEPVGVLLGFEDDRVVCYDAATGEQIGDYQAMWEKWVETAEALKAAEEHGREQVNARQAADAWERQQAKARQEAEKREREHATARQAAEERERQQIAARQA